MTAEPEKRAETVAEQIYRIGSQLLSIPCPIDKSGWRQFVLEQSIQRRFDRCFHR